MAHKDPFAPFPKPLPPAREALNDLYAAFADMPKPRTLACTQCFGPQDARRILKDVPLRTLPLRDFQAIFREHIDCSVGEEGFLYFLPRSFETSFFDGAIFPDLTGVALYCGLARLPEAQAAALRVAAARAALGFFRYRNTAPFFDGDRDTGEVRWNSYFCGEAGLRLLRVLLALRVEPREVFAELLGADSDLVWQTIAVVLQEDVWLEEAWACDREPPFNRLVSDIAWIDFFGVVGKSRLKAAGRQLEPDGPRSRTPGAVQAAFAKRRARVHTGGRGALVDRLRRTLRAG